MATPPTAVANGDAGNVRPSAQHADPAQIPKDTSGCPHTRPLRHMPESLRRLRAGLRWGRMIRAGQVMMDEEDELPEGVDRSKLLPYPECGSCTVALHRPFLCLECAHAACHIPARVPPGPGIDDESHIASHLHQSGHSLALEIHSGALFCALCDDLIYDAYIHHIVRQEHRRAPHFTVSGKKRHASGDWDDKSGMSMNFRNAIALAHGHANLDVHTLLHAADIKRQPEQWKMVVPCKGMFISWFLDHSCCVEMRAHGELTRGYRGWYCDMIGM